jgi:hypothetical protein
LVQFGKIENRLLSGWIGEQYGPPPLWPTPVLKTPTEAHQSVT